MNLRRLIDDCCVHFKIEYPNSIANNGDHAQDDDDDDELFIN